MNTTVRKTLQARVEGGGTPEMTDWYLKSETGVLKDVLLGPAETFRWLGLENAEYSSLVRDTLRRGRTFDKQIAMRQHREMVDAYEHAGVTCHFLPVDENVPYQIYARDSSFMTPYGAVICQLANPRRRGEYAAALRFYLEHDIPVYDMVSAGNFEGGDFNIIRHGVALLGYTDHRSEEVAANQVADWFIKEGWETKFAPIDQFYVHIDLMVCMLNEHCAAVCLETTDDEIVTWLREKKIEIIPASFKETMALGCNVVALGNDRVLSTLGATDLNAKMRANGFHVYDPEMTMFTWAGGGVHCMCQPLRREAA
ncbi:MAG: dimethylarginine dimethylaminohydrolase family protein [Hyphomicrobiales bacterium]